MIHPVSIIRQSCGMTQEELADKAGVTVRTIQRLENGHTEPRAYTLHQIAKALDVSYEAVLSVRRTAEENNQQENRQSLQWLNLSCFAFLFIPWIHALVPYHIWKKNKTDAGRRLVMEQIGWSIALQLSLLLALIYNLASSHYLQEKAFILSYLWIVAGFYGYNTIRLVKQHVRLKSAK